MPELHLFSPIDSQIFVWKITESISELLNIAGKDADGWKIYKTEIHQKQFLAKKILLQKLNLTDKISYLENGKPVLANDKHISISHSKNFISIVLSNQPIGVDMEFMQTKLIKVAPKFIHPDEQQLINIDNPPELLYFWTAKESIYKLIGKNGLSFKRDILIEKIDYSAQTGKAKVYGNKKIKLFFNKINDDIIICQSIFDKQPV
jgi:phosphopantetheinyl transferase